MPRPQQSEIAGPPMPQPSSKEGTAYLRDEETVSNKLTQQLFVDLLRAGHCTRH